MKDQRQVQRRSGRINRGLRWAVILSLIGFSSAHVEQQLTEAMVDTKSSAVVAFPEQVYSYKSDIVGENIKKIYYVSDKADQMILTSMEKASDKYRLPIMLMYAIFRVESDYRYWITHPTVKVTVNGRKIKTNAIGLGGVMWCFWQDSLKANHIAETESDLYLPDVNVMATGYILRTLIDNEIKNNPKLSKSNILNNVVRRYYGEYSKRYLNKMCRFTSKLWMSQVAEQLMTDISKKDSTQQLAELIE